jgi:Sulfotransferase domain
MIKNSNNLIKSKIKRLPKTILGGSRRMIRRLHWKGNSRIFCISMQRSGTTSVGNFFTHFGYPTCNTNKPLTRYWSRCWYDGDFETIFKSKEFLSYQVFEDNPWWSPSFYKILYHRFPNSKFILMNRDSDDWFKSMISLSDGKTLGNTKRHCKIYRRELEFYKKLDFNDNFKPEELEIDNLMDLKGFEEHYKSIYEIHNREVIDFFKSKDSGALFHCSLYDKDKWYQLGKFLDFSVPKDFEIHSNKSKKN